MRQIITTALLATGLMAACASAPPPNRTLESTTATLRAAEEMGAGRSAKAATHLQMAKDQAERARLFYNEGHQERAAYLLMRADADADLAVALTRREAAETETQKATDGARRAVPDTTSPR